MSKEIREKESNNIPNHTIETDNIKYPTFQDTFLEEQINYNTNSISIQVNLQTLYESLNAFILKFDNVFKNSYPHSQLIKESFLKHKIDYIQLRIRFLFFNRQIEFFYRLFSSINIEFDKRVNYEIIEKYQTQQLFERTVLINNFIKDHYYYIYEEDDNKFKYYIEQIFTKQISIEDKAFSMINDLGKDYLPSISIFNIAILFVLGIMNHLFNDLKIFNSLIDFTTIECNEVIKFYNDLHQLDVCCEVLYNFYRVSANNIFNKDENGEEWDKLKKYFFRIVPYSKIVVQKKMEKVVELVNIGYASISKACDEQHNNTLLKTASAGAYMAYYFFNSKQAKTQSMKFLINPDTKISQMIWNMLDVKGIKMAWKIVLPHIKYSKKWFIKRIAPEITLKDLNDIEKDINHESYKINHLNLFQKKTTLELFEKINNENIIIDSIDKTDIHKMEEYVRIKIIHSLDFYIKDEKRFFNFINSCYISHQNTTRNALIIHIHGGGFIAMSSSSHENYTRKWANKLHVPVIGIDYSLSPKSPFPKALDDVYQAYLWIIENGEELFLMNLRTIILVGDSAGGNIALALTYLLIIKEKRLPTAVFLAYPALKLCLEELSLSYMNSLSDPVLEYNLLKFCLESYSKNCSDGHNPFMSPIFMNDKVMKYLPPIRIYSGSSDPLRDDSILLLKRLVNLQKDVQMKEFKYFPHGFLSYDNQVMLSEASVANDIIIQDIETFL